MRQQCSDGPRQSQQGAPAAKSSGALEAEARRPLSRLLPCARVAANSAGRIHRERLAQSNELLVVVLPLYSPYFRACGAGAKRAITSEQRKGRARTGIARISNPIFLVIAVALLAPARTRSSCGCLWGAPLAHASGRPGQPSQPLRVSLHSAYPSWISIRAPVPPCSFFFYRALPSVVLAVLLHVSLQAPPRDYHRHGHRCLAWRICLYK